MSTTKLLGVLGGGIAIGAAVTTLALGNATAPRGPDAETTQRLARLEQQLAAIKDSCARIESARAAAPAPVAAAPEPAPVGSRDAPAPSAERATASAADARETPADRQLEALTLKMASAQSNPREMRQLMEELARLQGADAAEAYAGWLQSTGSSLKVSELVDILRTKKEASIRRAAVEALAAIRGPEATRALQDIAASDADPEAKAAATKSVELRTAPVEGLWITSVAAKSRAEAAGLKVGDILVAYNGEHIRTSEDVREARNGIRLSQTVPIQVWRSGQALTLTINGGTLGITGESVPQE